MWSAESRALRAALLPDRALLLERGARSASEWPAEPAGADAPAWQPALGALQRALQSPERAGARALSVVLGAAFVRWQLMPWPTGVSSPAELDAALRMRLRAVHGAAVDGWRVQAAPVEAGAPVLACAVDSALHTGLAQLCRAAGLRLLHLRPYASAVLDRGRALAARGPAWLAVLEPGHLTLCLREQGRITALRTVRCPSEPADAWQSLLPALQSQLAMHSGSEVNASAPLYLAGPGSEDAQAPAGLQLHRLDTGAERGSGLARMALGC